MFLRHKCFIPVKSWACLASYDEIGWSLPCMGCTLKPWYNEPRYSEFCDIVNKNKLLFWWFTKYSELFDIVNKKVMTDLFAISRFECTSKSWKNYQCCKCCKEFQHIKNWVGLVVLIWFLKRTGNNWWWKETQYLI